MERTIVFWAATLAMVGTTLAAEPAVAANV
ncbi:MAG: hypothetical protein DVB23_001005, partial [Verrucomicrobia bacterium]